MLTVGDRIFHATTKRFGYVIRTERGLDVNALSIILDGAILHIDTRACFVTKVKD